MSRYKVRISLDVPVWSTGKLHSDKWPWRCEEFYGRSDVVDLKFGQCTKQGRGEDTGIKPLLQGRD